MGTLPFPPKRAGYNHPAHLAVEAISNGESGEFILLTHGMLTIGAISNDKACIFSNF